jgi:LytS/YehU family sensor histidine kinase
LKLPKTRQLNDLHFGLIHDGIKNQPILMLQISNIVYKIKYRENPYYFMKYPAYAGIYILLFLVFWILQRVQTKLAQRKFEEEKRLTRQQMALSKRQLEPHFMLNILNSIGQMFAAEEKNEAQYYFGKFASLIHRGLKYADKTETTLKEELAFIRDYLVLQQRRYDDFGFLIEAEEDINLDETLIPHSLVYTFAENALKHGLRDKEGKKNLEIIINKQDEKFIITIRDNGIGRKQSKVKKTRGTGKGLIIIANIVEGYNKLNKRDISFEVKDLFDEDGKSAGTEVRVVA